MEGETEFRPWDKLSLDLLALVFSTLPLCEVVRVISLVCKSWGKYLEEPHCWQRIDLGEWCNIYAGDSSEHCAYILENLILRSKGFLRDLHVSSVDIDQILFIAKHAGDSLQTLTMRVADISDTEVEQFAQAVESIGRNCQKLESLILQSYMWEMARAIARSMNISSFMSAEELSHEEVARAIARSMPKLKHLCIPDLRITTPDAMEILQGCPELETLDIHGCADVTFDKNLLEEKFPNLKVLGPEHSDDGYDDYDDDECLADFYEMPYGSA